MTTLRLVDGVYEEKLDDSATISNALTASGAPLYPPDDWFKKPIFRSKTPVNVTAAGHLSGHIAGWDTQHIGMPHEAQHAPHSESDYAYFRTGILQTQSGREVPVGQLTLAGGHASMSASAAEAVAHYDDTSSAVADVTCGEDDFGIWISGALRPGVSDEQIRALRASAPSGDWRPINGALELVAVCQVNTPGFPVARAMVAAGKLTALVASGASDMFALQQESMVMSGLQKVAERVAALEAMVASAGVIEHAPEAEAEPVKRKVRLYNREDETALVAASEGRGHDTHTFPITGTKMKMGTNSRPADGPRVLPARTDAGENVLIVLTPDDSVDDSVDSVDTSDVKQDGIDANRKGVAVGPTGGGGDAISDLTGVGTMPDGDDGGTTDMKTSNQGPNGSAMDDDGDFDGTKVTAMPDVESTKADDDPNFSHTLDKCNAGCVNPAHSEAKALTAKKSRLRAMRASMSAA